MMRFERQARKSRSTNRKHKIVVERPIRTNVNGDGVPVWNTEGTYWASVEPITEKQRHEYQTINMEITHFVRCNGRADIQPKDRIKFKGTRYLEVLTIVNIHEVDRDKLIATKEVIPKQIKQAHIEESEDD